MKVELTNLLLTVLIGLLGTIAMVFYKKLEELAKKIETILLSDVSHSKDIEQLKADRDEHEKRITKLETDY